MGLSLKNFVNNIGPTWTGQLSKGNIGVNYGKNDWSLLPRTSEDWGRRFGMGAVEAGFYEKALRHLDQKPEDPPPPESPGGPPPNPGEANEEVRRREQEDSQRRKRRKYYANSNSAGFGSPDVSGSSLLLGE